LVSMSGNCPVSSPTCTMETTIGGKIWLASMGDTMDSPSFTLSWMLSMAVLTL
jgi:hypothetical protein